MMTSILNQTIHTQQSNLEAFLSLNVFNFLYSSILASNEEAVFWGQGVSPGCTYGRICFSNETALDFSSKGDPIILIKDKTTADDIEMIRISQGVMTIKGGYSSHAAIIARAWQKPAIVGVKAFEEGRHLITLRGKIFEGEFVSMNGITGGIWLGKQEISPPNPPENFYSQLAEADEIRKSIIEIYANADTEKDIHHAIQAGAQGIGICRTEHMFFDPNRLPLLRQVLHNQTEEKEGFKHFFFTQKQDFSKLMQAVNGNKLTIRMLDAPLHEFSSAGQFDLENQEANPMLGLRGIRLAIVRPWIYQIQIKAVLEAALDQAMEKQKPLFIDLLVPMVSLKEEMSIFRQWVQQIQADYAINADHKLVKIKVGTMIETPRAALIAEDLAKLSDFFSFGTNDLSQMTFGFSRDDLGTLFFDAYYSQKILQHDPFAALDIKGVGHLMKIACEKGRANNQALKIGLCGEQANEFNSIQFAIHQGLDYVSCSSSQVVLTRFLAAKAVFKDLLRNRDKDALGSCNISLSN